MATVIHTAGPMMPDGLQECSLCGETLADYRGVCVSDSSDPISGWERGTNVGVDGGLRWSTRDPATCNAKCEALH